MAQPPNPSKLQQAVATNKAAQATRETRVAAANKKIAQIQSTKSEKPKGLTGPTGPAITTTTTGSTGSTGVTAPVITYNDGIDWVAETEAEFRALGMADFGPVLTRLVQQGYKGTALTSNLKKLKNTKHVFLLTLNVLKKV